MAKVKRIKFNTDYYEAGIVKYAAGQDYPPTAETATRVLAGDADEVMLDMDPAVAAAEVKAATDELNAERADTIAAEKDAGL